MSSFKLHERNGTDALSAAELAMLADLDCVYTDANPDTGYTSEKAEMMLLLFDDEAERIVGKAELSIDEEKHTLHIHWLCAPNHGKRLLSYIETRIIVEYRCFHIDLTCSLSCTESESVVLARINFWSANRYRVVGFSLHEDCTRLQMRKSRFFRR
jgi:hypothetical protein